jgi:type IV pilus assembly protein PilV
MLRSKGIVSIEALLAMFIFSIGILALAGLQVKLYLRNQDARLRMESSILANELLSMVQADTNNANCYTVPVSVQTGCNNSAGSSYTNGWVTEVNNQLPGSMNYPPQASLNANRDFTISIKWQRPQDLKFHEYSVTTNLGTS